MTRRGIPTQTAVGAGMTAVGAGMTAVGAVSASRFGGVVACSRVFEADSEAVDLRGLFWNLDD